MATHSSVLAFRIPGTGEPGGLPSLGSHRVGHDWSDLAAAAVYMKIGNSMFFHKIRKKKKKKTCQNLAESTLLALWKLLKAYSNQSRKNVSFTLSLALASLLTGTVEFSTRFLVPEGEKWILSSKNRGWLLSSVFWLPEVPAQRVYVYLTWLGNLPSWRQQQGRVAGREGSQNT